MKKGNKTAILVAGLGGLAVIAFVAISFLLVGTDTPLLKQPSNSNVQAGAALYSENCASCHGKDLEGQPDWRSQNENGMLPAPPHDESGHTWHHGDALLFEYTKLGGQAVLEASGATGFTSGMPRFEGQLTDEEIWDILAFIKSNWSERARLSQAERSEGE
ncbi:c-type cytochrome [Falsihalocynthiibacter arcticus]|uniref:Cytochrome C n=1 Tax=Falsihalocynthiibacter arcticus TaxID=1579316 RepID=A0A126V689_9RHOB|nr:c-type cytochrome [Falsihalocynthiibacter arcticus]AML53386.1 cytochrome C [Falsihalocynthiibacter arcticus]